MIPSNNALLTKQIMHAIELEDSNLHKFLRFRLKK
jgi:hypothetical protein